MKTITPEFLAMREAMHRAATVETRIVLSNRVVDAMLAAALLSVREPTGGMVQALLNVNGYNGRSSHARNDIRAVIDHILGETEPTP
jgi:isocitrate dehydrogenase